MWTCPKCGETLEAQFDSCWKCAGKPAPIGLPLKSSHRQILSGILLAIGFLFVTWLCFGFVRGFHHMYVFGITDYLGLNGEDPQPGDRMWGEFAVKFFPGRLAVAIVLWLLLIFVVFKLARFLSKIFNKE